MADEFTERLSDSRSFEDRVFARFDALDRRMESLDARMDSLDGRMDSMDGHLVGLDRRVQVLESKAYDTKPIWERALAEISEVKEAVFDLGRKITVLTEDMMQLRADQLRIERRMDRVESRTQ